MMLRHTLLIPWLILMLLAGCARNDETGEDTSAIAPGVDFLMFPNPQASLGVGDYDVVIENNTASTITYTLTVNQTDGTSQTSTGTVLASPATATVSYGQNHAGGVTISLNSGGALATLRLCVYLTTCTAASPNIASAAGANPSISLPRFEIDQTAYAQAYYAAIDPANNRDTLANFKTTNGFGASCNPNGVTEFEVRFRDVRDLGYGRHMCIRGDLTAPGDIAVWVENFQVSATSDHYGPLNLEALVNDDRRWHVGTNAIEYSAGPGGGARFLKFYTYNPDGTRRTVVDLDGRGAKAMPVPCISCHGGRANPLLDIATAVAGGGGVMSRFSTIPDSPRGSTLARMQPVNVDTLDFWTSAPYRRIDQEATLKAINRLVLCTYPLVLPNAGSEDNCRTPVANSEWQGTNAAMIKAWYGGDTLPNPTQSDTFIPGTPGVEWAAGTEQNIYRTVVAPNCRVCHSLRGNANQSDIDFTTYAKFSGYADRIKYHVFDKGNMPLALLKFKQFWESDAPATLASIVPGSTSGGSVLKPNRPVAKTGPDRVVPPGATKLSAAESTNASLYSWSTAAPCSFGAETTSTLLRPTLTTGANGTYCIVQLVVSDGTTSSTAATLLVVASSTAPSGTKFNNVAADILPSILRGPPGCNGCHTTPGITAIPLYYAANIDYDGDGDAVDDAADLHQLYLNVRARINFTDVEASPLLRKPTGNHHCGGSPLTNAGLPGDAGRVLYDRLLNWILDGAPE